MSQKTDEQLIAAFQRGDSDAFEVFVIHHQDRIFRLAQLWLADTDAAADVLQETLLRSYTGFHRFRFRATPTTWLLRICRNVCREFNRRRRLETLDPETAELLDDSDPGGEIDRGDQLNRLHQAIRALPERQRQPRHCRWHSNGLSKLLVISVPTGYHH